MSKIQRRRFDAQFKHDVLQLVHETNRKISDIAKDLGVHPELLYRWKSEQKADPEHAFPGKRRMKLDEEYVRRLECELTQACQECDILRKALAYFSVFSRFSLILLQLLITFRRHHEVLTLAKVE